MAIAERARPGMTDAVARVTGRVPYAINVPAILHGRILRSTSPHARIRKLDVSHARAVPGVTAVITGADLLARGDLSPFFGPVFRDQPILAIDRVRYVGEPVAAIAAVDADAAKEALARIDVEYDELPSVFDPTDALESDAPVLHHDEALRATLFADVIVHPRPGTNVCNVVTLRKGDVEAGFAEADEIFEDVFSSPPIQHVPLETHACIAEVADGRVTVTATTQTPFVLRAQLAEVFRVPQSRVRVIVPTLGGAYGAKCYPSIEPIAAALALVARRRVKVHLTREEEFVTVTKHGVRIWMRTGLRKNGTIVARTSTCHFNTGAYANIGPRLIIYGALGQNGPYAIPNISVDSYAVYTNYPPAGAFRGYGINQSAWAYETQMDMIAERMGIDALELRRRNFLRDGDAYSTGDAVEDVHYDELAESAARWVGWSNNEPKRDGTKVRAKGLGVVAWRPLPLAVSTALAKLNDDASLDVLTSSVEMGQGLLTVVATIAADTLGIPREHVHVSTVDTDVTPYDQQTSASRSTSAMGTSVKRAVKEIRMKLMDHAGELLEVAPNDLEVSDGRVAVRGVPERSLEFGEIVRKTRSGNILGEGRHNTVGALDPDTTQAIDRSPGHWHQAAGAAEVEVDTETGKVTVLRYHAGVYAGRIINPVQAELQTEGNVAFGVSQALFEEMLFDNGQLQNGNLGDYMITSFEDMPRELDLSILESPDRREIHGLGEPSLPPVMPAIGNAVYRATGVRIVDLPITPEKILRGLREQAGAATHSEWTGSAPTTDP
jgi:CO/xanthine dehydrogenase Mo-binding subunit